VVDDQGPVSVSSEQGLDLRQVRTFVTVAQRRSFTRAAEDLFIAQQAVSQQIKSLERQLGVTLLRRSSRSVELTREGEVFLADARRLLTAADRASRRVRAAASGTVGTLRLAYTLTTAWETTPRLLDRLAEAHPELRVQAREVWGGEITELLLAHRYDLALAPASVYPHDFECRPVRHEELRVAVAERDPLARRRQLRLTALRDRRFELWPRDMAPGFYDAVVATCRAAGIEPERDERAAGNTVWGNIARGRGVALINASLAEQLPAGIKLVRLAPPGSALTCEAVWLEQDSPVIERVLEAADELAGELGWV
jgi:DNA-binding transcriptional LysR family regulator